MPIEKLEEFARDGQKNTDELILTDGFPRPKFPARQWFNYLFNMLSLKINELIELDPISKTEIVDDLETDDATKVASARVVKELNDRTLSKVDFDDAYKYMPIPYPKLIPPSGFLVMMGQSIVESIYPKLFALYGSKLPDMRAYMIRGLDNGRGIDLGREILSEQEDAIRNIEGQFNGGDGNFCDGKLFQYIGQAGNQYGSGYRQALFNFNVSRVVPTASENRVKNIAFLYIIKAG